MVVSICLVNKYKLGIVNAFTRKLRQAPHIYPTRNNVQQKCVI